jgi:Cyclin M transmembrane N-terminal domain
VGKIPKSRIAIIALFAVAAIVDIVLIAFYNADIAKSWPWGDWPGSYWIIDWPALIFWTFLGLLVLLVLVACHEIILHLSKKALANFRHFWTFALFIGGGIFLVVLPYHAIVERRLWFWGVVILGLSVSFICSASELAFLEVCVHKSDKGYGDYDKRLNELSGILDDNTKALKERTSALKEQLELQRLAKIRDNYTARINPTLAIATNVANMLVAVVSTAAIWDQPDVTKVGRPCSWMPSPSQGSFWERAILHLPSLRCVSPFGFGQPRLPFPVNVQTFQTALALTLILMIGEILPKQLAQTYPRALCRPRLYYFVASIFGLGSGLSLGRFSEWITETFVSIVKKLKH